MVPLSELKPVDAGHSPEVSVKGLYEDFANRPEIKKYMPSKVYKGRMLNKEYLFNIVSSLTNQELQEILQHANAQLNSIDDQQQRSEAILMVEQMAQAMQAYPWISVSIYLSIILSFIK